MRRSFGGNHGGSMLRTLSGTVQEPFSSPTGRYYSWRSSSVDDVEWVCVDDIDDGFDDFVLGPVPCRREAQSALTALQQVIEKASFSQMVRDKYGETTDVPGHAVSPTSFIHRAVSSFSDSDWAEPSLQLCFPRMLESRGSGTVYDAFHLLQTDPSVQRMVVSLSSDPSVWNAVLNNEAVQELRHSIFPDDTISISSLETDYEDSEAATATSILKWIFDNTKAKAMEIIEMIHKLVKDLFQPLEGDDNTSTDSTNTCFEEKLRYSLMLTVVILLIVAVARDKRA